MGYMSRVQVILEPGLYSEVKRRSKRSGASLSLTVRDLVRKGLEIEEDVILSEVAEYRFKSLDRSKTLWVRILCDDDAT